MIIPKFWERMALFVEFQSSLLLPTKMALGDCRAWLFRRPRAQMVGGCLSISSVRSRKLGLTQRCLLRPRVGSVQFALRRSSFGTKASKWGQIRSRQTILFTERFGATSLTVKKSGY